MIAIRVVCIFVQRYTNSKHTLKMADFRKKRKYCEHCHQYLSLRTYRRHLSLYFDCKNKKWKCDDSSDDELFANINAPNNDSRQEALDMEESSKGEQQGVDTKTGSSEEDMSSDEDDDWAYTNQDNRTFGTKKVPAIAEVWELSEKDINFDFTEDGDLPCVDTNPASSLVTPMRPIAKCAMVFLCLWTSFCSVSDNALDILLSFLRVLLERFH
ncbi:uncharacterized protein LOC125560596 [Nematostella vectensis]|uniref:uncharacterized protein LOC125560596 n=1 Tax=Nematostella vectensis TaxID=45351 RepID=UPI0020776AB1|nr:uncharacterized protein LOC125560596 [Nematostella vectensis]